MRPGTGREAGLGHAGEGREQERKLRLQGEGEAEAGLGHAGGGREQGRYLLLQYLHSPHPCGSRKSFSLQSFARFSNAFLCATASLRKESGAVIARTQ